MWLLQVMYCVFNFAQKHKSKYYCLPFYLVTLFLIDTLTLVKHEGTCVFWNYTHLMSCTLDLYSVITCKKATTSGIFSIGVGYCGNSIWIWVVQHLFVLMCQVCLPRIKYEVSGETVLRIRNNSQICVIHHYGQYELFQIGEIRKLK